jgi:hypothetical protein
MEWKSCAGSPYVETVDSSDISNMPLATREALRGRAAAEQIFTRSIKSLRATLNFKKGTLETTHYTSHRQPTSSTAL